MVNNQMVTLLFPSPSTVPPVGTSRADLFDVVPGSGTPRGMWWPRHVIIDLRHELRYQLVGGCKNDGVRQLG
jgi:hypothetical protein